MKVLWCRSVPLALQPEQFMLGGVGLKPVEPHYLSFMKRGHRLDKRFACDSSIWR